MNFYKYIIRKIQRIFRSDSTGFFMYLKECRGVIHIGAHTGQERYMYEKLGLKVIWVEPQPTIFQRLQSNIQTCPNQQAFQYLLSDTDHKKYDFHITDNQGESSSLFLLKDHAKMFPHVHLSHRISLTSTTFDTFIQSEHINITDYDVLVLDTQGSELLILKGAKEVLSHFTYIQVEVADFEAYEGCCLLHEIHEYLLSAGLREYARRIICRSKQGTYYDIVYTCR